MVEGPNPGVNWPKQIAAPYPWVCIIPSKQALKMKEVNFNNVSDRIRYNMSFEPFKEKYKYVRLVLVDYSIVPASTSSKNKIMVKHGSETYSQDFIKLPECYQLKLSFYEGNGRPPNAPSFEETITMPTSKAPANEAFLMLPYEIMYDLKVSDLNQLKVHLD